MKAKWFLCMLITLLVVSCATQGKASGVSGTASASADGFGGTITVTVIMENGKITNVEADGPDETQGIGSRALMMLPARMVENNSVEVDILSGASISSQGIINAAREAAAKING
jgi:fumarate reductase flavoprotein subunit